MQEEPTSDDAVASRPSVHSVRPGEGKTEDELIELGCLTKATAREALSTLLSEKHQRWSVEKVEDAVTGIFSSENPPREIDFRRRVLVIHLTDTKGEYIQDMESVACPPTYDPGED
tara:strand:- start:146 stop:493 length:348 start_codon:yes stop_codon:yes gene_type:complete